MGKERQYTLALYSRKIEHGANFILFMGVGYLGERHIAFSVYTVGGALGG